MTENLIDPSKFARLISEAAKSLKKLSEELKQEGYIFLDYKSVLLKNGWFIPYEIKVKDVMQLAFQFENNQSDQAHIFLIKYFRKKIKTIQAVLIEKYPERKEILNEAFKAHQKKMFHSSTILFLSQADGITDNRIFIGRKFKKFTQRERSHPLVKLFDSENPLTSSFYKNKKDIDPEESLNRHGIVHGHILEYGSELNSLRALSLLYFVSNFRNAITK